MAVLTWAVEGGPSAGEEGEVLERFFRGGKYAPFLLRGILKQEMIYYKENIKRLLLIKDNYLIPKNVRDRDIAKWFADEKWIKDYRKKKARYKTIYKNIEEKKLFYYGLLSIDGSKKDRQDIEKMRIITKNILNYNKIDYYIVPELHADGVNYHYHGFIGALPDQLQIRIGKNGKPIKDKYGNQTYLLKVWNKNIGFSSLVDMRKVPEFARKKAIKYCVKYAVKDGVKASSNRKKWTKYRIIETMKDILGEYVKIT